MIFGEGPIIKNIAGDLNKLFLQGSRIGQPITNVEGDAAADQGTADLLAAMDPVIQEVAVGMSGEESMQYTVSGTPPLSLTNSLGMPLRSWSVNVSPYQEGSGDPSPSNVRPIHGTNKLNLFVEGSYDPSATPKAVIDIPPLGKNLFDPNAHALTIGKFINTSNGNAANGSNTCACLDFLPVPNGVFTISCAENVQGRIAFYDSTETFITGSGGNTVVNVTPPSNAAFFRFSLTSDTVTKVQLELGSSATTYETFNNTIYTGMIGADSGESEDDLITLDGTETYVSSYWGSMFVVILNNVNYSECVKCTIAKPTPSLADRTHTCYVEYRADVNRTYIGFGYTSEYATTADFAAMVAQLYAAGTPVQVVAKRGTSQPFSIAAPDIQTPTGAAQTWATAEDGTVDGMEVTYVGRA